MEIRDGKLLFEYFESTLHDPMKDATASARKLLLIVSLMGFAVSWGGVLPEKITVLGIQLQSTDQKWLLTLVASVVLYSLIRFSLLALTDLTTWELNRVRSIHKELDRREQGCRTPGGDEGEPPEIGDFLTREQVEGLLGGTVSIESVNRGLRLKHIEEVRRLLKESRRSRFVLKATVPISITRSIFELMLPIVIGLAAFGSLFWKIGTITAAAEVATVSRNFF